MAREAIDGRTTCKTIILAHDVKLCFICMVTLPTLPLESLRVFEACARHSNFTRAAEELSVTTTAVSQRVRNLERQLGTKLFARHGPRVELTEPGAALSDRIRDALGMLRDAVADCSSARSSLRLTSAPTFANRWLVAHLPAFHQAHPLERIRLDISTEERAPGQFDVAIRSGRGPWPALECHPILPVEAAPLMTPHLAAGLADPTGLAGLPLIPDDRWEAWFALAGLATANCNYFAAQYPSQDASAAAVLGGAAAALLSPTLFSRELASGALVAPFPQVLRGPDWFWLVWHRDGPGAPFVTWLQAAMRSLSTDGCNSEVSASWPSPNGCK